MRSGKTSVNGTTGRKWVGSYEQKVISPAGWATEMTLKHAATTAGMT
jgi:hypothetical protein